MHATEKRPVPLPLTRIDALPVLLALGILGYRIMGAEPSLWTLLAVPVWGGVALLHRRQPAIRDTALAMVVMIIGLMAASWQTTRMDFPTIPQRYKPWIVTGRVESVALDENKYKLLLAVESVVDLAAAEMPRYIRVGVRGKSEVPPAGARVRMRAILYAPSPPLIPGGFDFARYFYYRGIGAVGYALPPVEILERAEAQSGLMLRFSQWRASLQAWLLQRMAAPANGIAIALVSGDTTAIDKATAQAFRLSSLSHILSISGAHMSIVCGLLFLVLRMVLSMVPPVAHRGNVKKLAAVMAMLAGGAYLLLAEYPVSAVRAYVMIGFFFAGVLLDREAITLRSLVWAAVVILLVQPSSLLEPGFQLSFAATVALVVGYRNFIGVGGAGGEREERSVPRRVVRYLGGIVISSLIASLATAPLIAYHFNQFVLYGILANVAALPLLSFVIMPSLLLALLLWPLGMEGLMLRAAQEGIDAMLWVANWVAAMPGAAWYMPPIAPEVMLLMVIGMGLVLFVPRLWWRLGGTALVLLGMSSGLLYTPPSLLVAHDGHQLAVHVAEGDTWVLVRGKSNRNFVVQQWQQRLGVTMLTYAQWSKAHPGAAELDCTAEVCTWHHAGVGEITFPLHGRDLVLWGKEKITYPDLDRYGSYALWLSEEKQEGGRGFRQKTSVN